MAVNYFLGWSEADLRAELRRCQEDLAAGKTQTNVSTAGVSGGSQVSMAITTRITLLLRALNKLNPDDFPIDQVTPITVARVSF